MSWTKQMVQQTVYDQLRAYYRRHGQYPSQVEVAPELVPYLEDRYIVMPDPALSLLCGGYAASVLGDTLLPAGSLLFPAMITIPFTLRGDWVWRQGHLSLVCPDLPAGVCKRQILFSTLLSSLLLWAHGLWRRWRKDVPIS